MSHFQLPGTNQLMASDSLFCNQCSFLRTVHLIIRYTCTVPTCRITTVSYLPTLLTFLLQSYTQGFRSAGKLSYPVRRVLLAVCLTVRTVTLKQVRHYLSSRSQKISPFPSLQWSWLRPRFKPAFGCSCA